MAVKAIFVPLLHRIQNGYQAALTGDQGSHIMTSLVKANALLIVPEGVKLCCKPREPANLRWMIDWPETRFLKFDFERQK